MQLFLFKKLFEIQSLDSRLITNQWLAIEPIVSVYNLNYLSFIEMLFEI